VVAKRRRVARALAVSIALTTALAAAAARPLSAAFLWRRELEEIVSRLNHAHLADPDAREGDVEELSAFLLREESVERLDRQLTGRSVRGRQTARFAVSATEALGRRLAERHVDDLDESVSFQARLTLGEWPAFASLGTIPESRLAELVAATGAFKYGVDDFRERQGDVATLDLDGPGGSRIVLSYVEHGAHNVTKTAFVFDARGESITTSLVAHDGSIRWIVWHGTHAALVSEIYSESCAGGAAELVGVVAVRHRLLVWSHERFEEIDTFFTPFVEKYP
jgi:hypothetical protein